MIKELLNKINIMFRENKIIGLRTNTIEALWIILNLKDMCDNNIYTFDEIIKKENISDTAIPFDVIYEDNLKLPLNKLLLYIEHENIIDIITDYINETNYSLIKTNLEKELVIIKTMANYYPIDNKTLIFTSKNLYKVMEKLYKLFDKVLNLKHDYFYINDINIEMFDAIHVIDDRPKYRFILEDDTRLYDDFKLYLKNNNRLYFYTSYGRINNFKEGRLLLRYLKFVILFDNNKTCMVFDKEEEEEISIINYVNQVEKLEKIMEENKVIKDVLVKTNIDEIYRNNCRIGFRLYQMNKDTQSRSINEIVDQNSKLIEELSRINDVVEKEIDILINK